VNDTLSPNSAFVTVTAPARLHLGFLDLNGGLGHRFGSIGLSIDRFRTRIMVGTTPPPQVDGPEHDRARRHLETMKQILGVRGAYRLEVRETAPAHAGLGSGTQLALAIAAGMRRLHDLPLDTRGDAIRLARGMRSGAGVALFDAGGLVVDGGRSVDSATVAPVISRMVFPESWRVLVVLDPSRKGVHGPDESAAFTALPTFPDAEADHLCRLLVMQILPALADGDFAGFCRGINEVQTRLGAYFAPLQGGSRFTSPDVAAAIEVLEREGALGAGQSSWGPTGFAFAATPDDAARLVAIARQHPNCRGLDIHACRALNRGAEIVVHAAANAKDRR
jgi:beta-ribofuranosylaminobenzene 5'-phosphate synthase